MIPGEDIILAGPSIGMIAGFYPKPDFRSTLTKTGGDGSLRLGGEHRIAPDNIDHVVELQPHGSKRPEGLSSIACEEKTEQFATTRAC